MAGGGEDISRSPFGPSLEDAWKDAPVAGREKASPFGLLNGGGTSGE